MALFEAYSLDQLNRLLTFSKWMLIVCGVLFIIFAVLNQWLASRVSSLHEEENKQTQQQLRASRTELLRTTAKTNELTVELSRFVAPRTLPEEQIEALRKCLGDGPRGPVVIASLKSEADAEAYAGQIGKVLTDAGYDVTASDTVWLQLPVKGLYLCARDVANAPLHAVHIQRCFQTAGIRLRAHEDKKMYADMSVPDNAIIFVVGARD
jgi:membrane protein implicated in regulation of membrane protease activity